MELIVGIIIIVIFVAICLPKESNVKSTGRRGLYEQKLMDPRWKAKREKILKRDGYRCTWCGKTENLQVHHKYYMKYPDGSFAEPWDYPDDKLVTLCKDCHEQWHKQHQVKTYYRKWGTHYDY